MSELDFHSMRQAMVASQLRTSEVSDPAVIAAMNRVAREDFVPAEQLAASYIDRPVPLSASRALNPPLATARLIDALAIQPNESVLLVGAATGYAAAVLAAMGAGVTALEQDDALFQTATERLAGVDHVRLVHGPLSAGWAADAPYDAVMVDGAVAHLPAALIGQLKQGARAAAAIVERGVTRLAAGRRSGDTCVLAPFADAEAVILPGFDLPKGFSF